MEYTTNSPKETEYLAEKLAQGLAPKDVVLLYGDLGSGKSTFTGAIIRALGITEDIQSPTFGLMNIYELPTPIRDIKTVVHIDTYRLDTEQELLDIGAEDYIGAPNTITCIEWPEKMDILLKNRKQKKIWFTHLDKDKRTVKIDV